MAIINSTDADYSSRRQGIRMFVNNQYTTEDLPDATIENDIYLGAANRYVARRVPGYATLTEDKKADIKVAVQKLTAAEILLSELKVTQEVADELRLTQQGLAIKEQIDALKSDAEKIIIDSVPTTPGDSSPSATELISVDGVF